MPWTRNEGRLPPEAAGKRIRVKLRNGRVPPETWAADGRDACRWTLRDDSHDIIEWSIA